MAEDRDMPKNKIETHIIITIKRLCEPDQAFDLRSNEDDDDIRMIEVQHMLNSWMAEDKVIKEREEQARELAERDRLCKKYGVPQ